MHDSERILSAVGDISDNKIEAAARALGYGREKAARTTVYPMKKIISIIAVAALIAALGAAAYASDIFGIKTMLIDHEQKTNILPGIAIPEIADISISQPQAVDDAVDAAIREKIDNSAKAWAEWEEWLLENGGSEPEVFEPPLGTITISTEDNGDGTYTVIFTRIYDDEGNRIEAREERRTATAEEYELHETYMSNQNVLYGEYDFRYGIFSQEAQEALESIAAKYSLNLRRETESYQQDFDGSGKFNTREEIIQKINEICAGGKSFFRTEPTGFDKFYCFDEGTFGVCFFTEDTLVEGTSCYIYNSPYSTLSSGGGVIGVARGDIDAFTTRSHTTPDGTELTVMQNGVDIYAYVYLENSYVAVSIDTFDSLTDEEIDAILDMVDFSVIG